MKTSSQRTAPGYTTNDIRRYVGALPISADPIALDELGVQATRSIMSQTDPTWEQRISAQIDAITQEVSRYLDKDETNGNFSVSSNELRGIIAKAVTHSSSQYAFDIGKSLSEIPLMSAQFAEPMMLEATPNKSFKQPKLQQEIYLSD